MTARVVFYQLNARFLERAEDIPEDARQVVYYSLAIGHHVGVFDCFKPVLRCSAAVYDQVLAALPEDGEACRKLAGLRRFGEITIDRSHCRMLRSAIPDCLRAAGPEASEWLLAMDASLALIEQEPAVYLVGKRLA